MESGTTVVLLGGTSHVGKSTLAARLAERLGVESLSTDALGRHPGRPWPRPPAHVVEFFLRLSPEVQDTLLRHHHENMWPALRGMFVGPRLEHGPGLVLEGAALRPELVAEFAGHPRLRCVWLIAPEALVRARIERASDRPRLTGTAAACVDAFLGRSLRENERFAQAAARLGLPVLDAADGAAVERCAETFGS